jgi:hypothetical protein
MSSCKLPRPESTAITNLLTLFAAVCGLCALIAATPALAIDRCLAVAEGPATALVQKARMRVAQLGTGEVRISYVGHSTFVIESQKGIRIATDYNDYVRPAELPHIATMNRAHSTHYTNSPDPGIRHVLRGWNPEGGAAHHDVTEADVRIRNIPTNIRDFSGGTFEFGNSIFVFELGNLCIAHLGHLHHTLTTQQLAQLGQMDVVLVHARSCGHARSPALAQGAARHTHALLLLVHLGAIYRDGAQRFRDQDERCPHSRHFARNAPGFAASPRSAGSLRTPSHARFRQR